MSKVYFIDAATGEELLRDMTDVEQSHFDAMQADFEVKQAEAKKLAEEKAALLVKLGITADEAALLLG